MSTELRCLYIKHTYICIKLQLGTKYSSARKNKLKKKKVFICLRDQTEHRFLF